MNKLHQTVDMFIFITIDFFFRESSNDICVFIIEKAEFGLHVLLGGSNYKVKREKLVDIPGLW